MLTLNLTDHLGRSRMLRMKGPDELTLYDWEQLVPVYDRRPSQSEALDEMFRLVEAYSGMSMAELNVLPMKGVGQILEMIRNQLIEALKGSGDLDEALSESSEYFPKSVVELAGQRLQVPQDIELDTLRQQWHDWTNAERPRHEAQVFTQFLACMLLDSESKYTGMTAAKLDVMAQMGVAHAVDLCAYYFAKSERFRTAIRERSEPFQMVVMNSLVAVASRIDPNDKKRFELFAVLA